MRQAPKRLHRRTRPHPWPEVDPYAAARVAELVGVVSFDGRDVPFVRPRGDFGDHADFDAALCKAGVREFARAVTPSDWPSFSGNVGPHVLVNEIQPGFRLRQQASVSFTHEMN
jgi:hypothetical protein